MLTPYRSETKINIVPGEHKHCSIVFVSLLTCCLHLARSNIVSKCSITELLSWLFCKLSLSTKKAAYKFNLLQCINCVFLFVFQVAELEAQLGHPAAVQTTREELKRSLEELETLLNAKDQVRHPVHSLHCTLSKTMYHLKGRLCVRGNPKCTLPSIS